MGLRLLKVNPLDDEVKASMLPVLDVIGKPADGQLALLFANQLICEHPNYPKWYAMLGAIYDLISIRTNSRLDCQKSISAYEEYLRLAKKSDPFYNHAKYIITAIKKNMPK